MLAKYLTSILLVSSLPLAISAAHAACGDRPGTPNEVKAEPLASAPNTTIRLSWRNTTSRAHVGDHRMYFDISVRDGKGNSVGKDYTGHGPFTVSYGSRSHQDFDRLSTPQTLCFQIRARTEGGTQGCVSQKWSASVCATTVASAPAKPEKPVKTTGKPGTSSERILIGVTRESGNVFFVTGFGFRPNAPVTIRAVDRPTLTGPFITTIGGQRITAGGTGQLSVRLYNICSQARGPVSFSANDGRPNPADRTGTLWSNTVTVECQR